MTRPAAATETPIALEMRSPYLSPYPPPLITPYVHAAAQLPGVATAGLVGVLMLASARDAHPLILGTCGIAILCGALGGLTACALLVLWSRVRWERIHRTQQLFVAGITLVPFTSCLAGEWAMYLGILAIPLTLLAWFALAYIESRPFRLACAWRTSDAWLAR